MAKKVIGYQITNRNQDIPNSLFSFQIFKTEEQAFEYAREHGVVFDWDKGWFVRQVREGDIENPTYIGGEKKIYNVTFYYQTKLTVSVEAESEKEAIALADLESEKECYKQNLLNGLRESHYPYVELDEE
jgi:hypothetical protein